VNGNDFMGDVLGGDMLPFFFDVGEIFGDFLGDTLRGDLTTLTVLATGTGKGLGVNDSFTSGDIGFCSFSKDLGFGGDIFLAGWGGDGGGGAAFRAGIVIGDGTFCGENGGEIGEASFSDSLLMAATSPSLCSPNNKPDSSFLNPSPSGLPFFPDPFRFPLFPGFFTMTFPFTTDTVLSSSPDLFPFSFASSSSELSEPLAVLYLGFGETVLDPGPGDALGESVIIDSCFGVADFSFLMEDTHDWSPSAEASGFGGNILNFL
jgi:hypothetical protein